MKAQKKFLLLLALFLLALIGAVGIAPKAQAASVATNVNGKYAYYAQQGTIYRINTSTGTTKKIKTIADTNTIYDVTYYKGYLYFTVDYYYYVTGTDGTCTYICRMKANGKSFKKLCPGKNFSIYGGKIYFVRQKTTKDYGSTMTTTVGLGRMKTNGTSKKTLITDTSIYDVAVVNGQLHYSSSSAPLTTCSLSGKNAVQSVTGSASGTLYSDDNYVYLTSSGYAYSYEPSTGTLTKLFSYSSNNGSVVGVQNGYIYYATTVYTGSKTTGTIYRYNVSTGKTKKIKKLSNGYATRLLYGGSKWIVFLQYYVPSSGNLDMACAKVKTTGKNYKIMKKYFQP